MKEKRLLRGLSMWCRHWAAEGPQSTQLDFLGLMHQAETLLARIEAKAVVGEVQLFSGDNHCGRPNRSAILGLCLHLGIRAPEGWHGHFMLKREEYRQMIRPRKKWPVPEHIRETWKRNCKP